MRRSIKIPQVRFNLKYGKSKSDTCLILAVYRFHNKKLVYSTQHSIKPKLWDKKRQFPYTYVDHYDIYEKDLNAISKEITNYYCSLSEPKKKALTVLAFREYLDFHFKRKVTAKSESSFYDYLDKIIKKKSRIDTTTVDKYRAAKKHLQNYQEYLGEQFNFDTFNWSFKDDFVQYLYDHTKVESVNTASKYVTIIKTTLKEAYRDNKHTNLIFTFKEWSITPKKYKKITLTEDEIQKIADIDLSHDLRLDRTRDLFLIALYTGLRYSDFINIKPENIVSLDGEKCLKVFTNKTDAEVFIPFSDELNKVLAKYGNKSPETISNQRLNQYIKEVCKVAGIDDIVLYQKNLNGQTIQCSKHKYELCSSHVGRRSWATINYEKGFPIVLLRNVTGHASDAQFLDYCNTDKNKLAIELSREMKKKRGQANETAKVINL